MWVELAAIGGAILGGLALLFGLIKMLMGESKKGARNEERADRLAEGAELRARADRARSAPLSGIPRVVADRWRRRRRVREPTEGGQSTPDLPRDE